MFQAPPNPAPPFAAEVLPPPSHLPETAENTFFDAGYWFPTEGWSNSFEIGVNGSTGNAESFSMRTGAHIQRTAGGADYTLDIKYAKTLASGLETQHNALVNSNVETNVGDSLWTTFMKTSFEYDEFKAWDVRAAMNAGVGYHLVKADDAKLIVRFGSGVSREVGGPDDEYIPEAVYGLEFDRRITSRQKIYGTVDYFPEWSNYRDYRLVTNAGWEFVLDAEANLSLKLGAIDRYDSTPHGRKPNDLDYSLVLLWKQ
jgi:putative salt-induced outer membrane protein YdiY